MKYRARQQEGRVWEKREGWDYWATEDTARPPSTWMFEASFRPVRSGTVNSCTDTYDMASLVAGLWHLVAGSGIIVPVLMTGAPFWLLSDSKTSQHFNPPDNRCQFFVKLLLIFELVLDQDEAARWYVGLLGGKTCTSVGGQYKGRVTINFHSTNACLKRKMNFCPPDRLPYYRVLSKELIIINNNNKIKINQIKTKMSNE